VRGSHAVVVYANRAPDAKDDPAVAVRPDHVVEIRADILQEVDGPMVRHGLHDDHGGKILLPRAPHDRPSAERLELRYEQFRQAS
jgi:putative restriction endonuclease